MYVTKISFVIISILFVHCAPAGMQSQEKDVLITQLTLDELSKVCSCSVSVHPEFKALRVSLAGNIAQFVHANKGCGILEVDVRKQKGWLFVSPSCEIIKDMVQ